MTSSKVRFAIVVLVAAWATSGCSVTIDPLLVPKTGLPSGYDAGQVEQAIKVALLEKGWSTLEEAPGTLKASVSSGGHSATVLIHYDGGGWTIEHVESSPGLKYDPSGPDIHKRYNNWVNSLDDVIRKKLAEPPATSAGAEAPETESEPATEAEGDTL